MCSTLTVVISTKPLPPPSPVEQLPLPPAPTARIERLHELVEPNTTASSIGSYCLTLPSKWEKRKQVEGGQGGVGGAVVGVLLAPRLLKKSSISSAPMLAPTTGLLQSTRPRGVLADAVDAGQGGVAGGEGDAGVDQLELATTKVCDVGASRALTTKLTALPKSQDRRLNGDHTLVKSTSLFLSLTFSIWEPKKKISNL